MNKFKTILIILSLIFFYFLIGIYFNSASSYDYSDTICFVDNLIKGEPRMIFLKSI